MRIEIDTKSDSREELRHLANMLMALSSSASSNVVVKQRNIFDDPSPGVGMMGMFNDSPSQPSQPQPAQSSSSLFSIFSDSPQQSAQSSTPTMALLDDEHKTSAEELIEDNRIIPYD
ncbi:hypothetical protein HZB90_03910 [archaeon]|nr:hypothetical protein [archaeon]